MIEIDNKKISKIYDDSAPQRDFWRKKNKYYYEMIDHLFKFLIPDGKKVLDLGCGTGDLLATLKPSRGVGVDISRNMTLISKKKYPKLIFVQNSADSFKTKEKFDYIILSDLVGSLIDIQETFENVNKISDNNTRVIITYYNYIWEPIFILGARLGLKMPQPLQNWLSHDDLKNLLELSNLEPIKDSSYLLIPFNIPLVSDFINKYMARLPLIRSLCVVRYFVVRKKPEIKNSNEYSVSVILPARNEEGNIARAIKEIPQMGKKTEIIFIEDHSKDKTQDEIISIVKKNKYKNIKYFFQKKESGKAAAVRKGFSMATGDIIFVFDSDLTTEPRDLPKFYEALRDHKADFIQGSRLVYPMEKDAMRFLNILGNKFFSIAFTFLLDQPVKDTLCGTKGMFREKYLELAKNRSYFGINDPFGDFDLIFGSSRMNLKILEIPIRYKARTYGRTNISRYKHGWLLLKMTSHAARKIKFF